MRVLLIEAPYHDLYTQRHTASFRRYFPQALAAKLQEFQPDAVGISTMSPAYPNAVDVARQVKEWKPVPVMMGGCHATASGQEVLMESPEIDYVIYGEGEQIPLDLCRHLFQRTPATPDEVPGIGWREGGRAKRSRPAEPIGAVDTIPFPARDLVDLSFFAPHTHMSVGKKRSTTMLP